MTEFIQGYKCPYCKTAYETHQDAQDCAKDCVEIEEVLEFEFWECEICGKKFDNEWAAEKCEEKHKEDKDKLFFAWEDSQAKEKLAKAASHPEQQKLKIDSFK